MLFGFDAKRAFLNKRGLGNYSRDIIRLMKQYVPDNYYILFTPQARTDYPDLLERNRIIQPKGAWRLAPSLWRSGGCIKQLVNLDYYWGLSAELPYGIHRLKAHKIVTIHDAIFIRYPELYSPTYRALFTRKVQYACDVADTIIAISEQTKRDIIDFFHADKHKIHVLYQGCAPVYKTPDLWNPKRVLDEDYLLYVSALEPRKNLEGLIRSIALAHISLPLVVVGGASAYGNKCFRLAQSLGVRVVHLGSLTPNQLASVYRDAVLFCYPSFFEGFGIPIVEAMTVGTPVLTSTGSCFHETAGDAATYVDPNSIEDIAHQLQRLLSDDALRAQMVQAGKTQAQLFTDEHIGNNLKQLFYA